jgi:hypothetical protein
MSMPSLELLAAYVLAHIHPSRWSDQLTADEHRRIEEQVARVERLAARPRIFLCAVAHALWYAHRFNIRADAVGWNATGADSAALEAALALLRTHAAVQEVAPIIPSNVELLLSAAAVASEHVSAPTPSLLPL